MTQFNDLLQKFIRDELTEAELQVFLVLVQEPANQASVKEAIAQAVDAEGYTDLTAGMDIDLQFEQVMKKAAATEIVPVRLAHRVHFLYRRWWAAAAVFLLLTIGGYFWLQRSKQITDLAVQGLVDIAPGKEGAILTLADGTKVVLDSLGNGVIATQNGTRLVLKNGQLAYDPTGKATGETVYNTMTTPKGRQFQLLLPDGTKVWLNAASSIKYPTIFSGKERRVTITGEAYFEVAPLRSFDKLRTDPSTALRVPFLVNVGNEAEVEVLGTHFNVNAYHDEPDIKTTLLEGSVKVVNRESGIGNGKPSDQSVVTLKPGEQALLSISSQSLKSPQIQVQTPDIDKVMAWKNGFFNFEGATIREVMKQLERWYDITVVYEKNVPNTEFFGEISRNVNLAELIVALEEMGVHLRMDTGRRLVVLP